MTPAAPSVKAGHTRSKLANLPATPPGADPIDPGHAALVAVPQYLGEMKSDTHRAVTATPATASEPRVQRSSSTDAKDLVRALVADVVPPSESRPNVAPPVGGNGAPQAASGETSGPVDVWTIDSGAIDFVTEYTVDP